MTIQTKGIQMILNRELSLFEKLIVLSGETTVMFELLAEDEEVKDLIRAGKSQDELVEYVNENY
jgi:hypothetical protein